MARRDTKRINGLTAAGLLLLAAALALLAYNLLDAWRAARSVEDTLSHLTADTASPQGEPDYLLYPEMPMPTVEVDGNAYIGTLEIPSLGLTLPVMSDWSDAKLRIAPCRYQGSAYQNDMIIAAHNYRSHFGRLGELSPGDTVSFQDEAGNRFDYRVTEIENLPGSAVEEMETGDWDLTLFTCTLAGNSRITVRCRQAPQT